MTELLSDQEQIEMIKKMVARLWSRYCSCYRYWFIDWIWMAVLASSSIGENRTRFCALYAIANIGFAKCVG